MFFGESACGLKYYVIPKEGFTKSYAVLAADFGSIDCRFEVAGERFSIPDGVAHFMEHKMFEQEDGGNAFDLFSKYGARANAFTTFDMTAYLFSAAERFDECLEHLVSYVTKPHFTKENVDKEQGIIAQEIKMYEDDPGWSVFFNMLRALYREHPVNIDIAGDVESISRITKDTLYTCYNSYYHPSNMLLCVIGNTTPERVEEIIDSTVASTPFSRAETILPIEDAEVVCEYRERKMSVANPLFAIGFKEEVPKEKLYAEAGYALLCDIMLGKGSELYNELYNEGLITSMTASYSYGKEYAFVEVSGESPEPKKVYERIKDELERIRRAGIDAQELEIIKKALYGKFLRGLNEPEAMGPAFISSAFFGEQYMSFGSKIMSFSKREIDKILQKGFKKSALSVILPLES